MSIPAEVIVHIGVNGQIKPLKIKIYQYGEERAFIVEKVGKPINGASFKTGVQGTRYSCVIDGKRVNLYQNNENKWFVEA